MDKLKKFRNKCHCYYCNYLFDSKEELESHLELSHGRYSLDKHKQQADTPDHRIYMNSLIDKKEPRILHKKSKPYIRPDISPDEIKYIQPYNDGSLDIICKNCLFTIHMTGFSNGLLLCPFCGLNVFKDNRQKVYDWLHEPNHPYRKLPKNIRLDVVESVISKEGNVLEIKRIKL